MRRPVGVKGIRFGICWSRCFFPAESPLSPTFHPHSSMSALEYERVGSVVVEQLLNRGASVHALVHKQRTLPQDFLNESTMLRRKR